MVDLVGVTVNDAADLVHDHLQGFPLVVSKRLVVHPGVVRERSFNSLHQRSAILELAVVLGPCVQRLVDVGIFLNERLWHRHQLRRLPRILDLLAQLIGHWLRCLKPGGHVGHIGVGVLFKMRADFV